MSRRTKINLTLAKLLADGIKGGSDQNNYIRTADAICYLIGSGLQRKRDRGSI